MRKMFQKELPRETAMVMTDDCKLLKIVAEGGFLLPKLLGRLPIAGIRSPGRPSLGHDIWNDYNR